MKIQILRDMINCRSNAIGFLHITDIKQIEEIAGIECKSKSFRCIAAEAFTMYDLKKISNKRLTKVVEILCENNSQFLTESHRYENGKIFKWCDVNKAYIFMKLGSKKEFNRLNSYI